MSCLFRHEPLGSATLWRERGREVIALVHLQEDEREASHCGEVVGGNLRLVFVCVRWALGLVVEVVREVVGS